MDNYTKKVLRYNIISNGKVKLHLQNCLISHKKLDKLFYKIIFRYVSPKYIHLYYEYLLHICDSHEINKVMLSEAICNINNKHLSNHFRYINKLYKYQSSRDGNYTGYNAMKYYNKNVIISDAQNKEDDIYVILCWLYDKYKDPLIIHYIAYVNIRKKDDIDFANMSDESITYNYLTNEDNINDIVQVDIHTDKKSSLYKKYIG